MITYNKFAPEGQIPIISKSIVKSKLSKKFNEIMEIAASQEIENFQDLDSDTINNINSNHIEKSKFRFFIDNIELKSNKKSENPNFVSFDFQKNNQNKIIENNISNNSRNFKTVQIKNSNSRNILNKKNTIEKNIENNKYLFTLII